MAAAALFAPGTVSFMPRLSLADVIEIVGLGEFGHRHMVAARDADQRIAAIDDVDGCDGPRAATGLLAGGANAGAGAATAAVWRGMISCWPGESVRGPL